jgi:hypothetical protein
VVRVCLDSAWRDVSQIDVAIAKPLEAFKLVRHDFGGTGSLFLHQVLNIDVGNVLQGHTIIIGTHIAQEVTQIFAGVVVGVGYSFQLFKYVLVLDRLSNKRKARVDKRCAGELRADVDQL